MAENGSGFLLCQHLTRIVKLLPFRRVFQGLVVLGQCLFSLALLREHVAPELPRIAIVGAECHGLRGIGKRSGNVPSVQSGLAAIGVDLRELRGQLDSLGKPLLRLCSVAGHRRDASAKIDAHSAI